MSKLVVIEGMDYGYKNRQLELLVDSLNKDGVRTKRLNYPINHEFAMEDLKLLFRDRINCELEQNDLVLLDRYVYSNMAIYGEKMCNWERESLYKRIEKREFEEFGFPIPDKVFFLYAYYKYYYDKFNDIDEKHLIKMEDIYLKMADSYNFETIYCTNNKKIRDYEEVFDELNSKVRKLSNNVGC